MVVQRSIGQQVLHQQHGERTHQFGCPVEALWHPFDFRDEVTGSIRMSIVVGIADVEHRVQELFFGLEVVQQSGRTDTGFAGDLRQRGIAPAVASH